MAPKTTARPKPAEAGRTFLAGVFEKLPEALRTQAMGVLDAAEAEEALAIAGEGYLRQDEFSRRMDEVAAQNKALATWRDDLATWKSGKEAELAEHKALIAKATELGYTSIQEMVDDLGENGAASRHPTRPAPVKLPENLVTSEALQESLLKLEQGALPVMTTLTHLGIKHFQVFGEALDLDELVTDPEVQKLGLRGVYDKLYGDRYLQKAKEKATADEKAIRDAAFAEGRDAARKEFGQQGRMPYPTRQASSLDVIDPSVPEDQRKVDPSKFTVDEAVAHYTQLEARREQQDTR